MKNSPVDLSGQIHATDYVASTLALNLILLSQAPLMFARASLVSRRDFLFTSAPRLCIFPVVQGMFSRKSLRDPTRCRLEETMIIGKILLGLGDGG